MQHLGSVSVICSNGGQFCRLHFVWMRHNYAKVCRFWEYDLLLMIVGCDWCVGEVKSEDDQKQVNGAWKGHRQHVYVEDCLVIVLKGVDYMVGVCITESCLWSIVVHILISECCERISRLDMDHMSLTSWNTLNRIIKISGNSIFCSFKLPLPTVFSKSYLLAL